MKTWVKWDRTQRSWSPFITADTSSSTPCKIDINPIPAGMKRDKKCSSSLGRWGKQKNVKTKTLMILLLIICSANVRHIRNQGLVWWISLVTRMLIRWAILVVELHRPSVIKEPWWSPPALPWQHQQSAHRPPSKAPSPNTQYCETAMAFVVIHAKSALAPISHLIPAFALRRV